jgi:hypothetical protein
MAYGSINKPAKFSTVKFPRRTCLSDFHGAFIYNPTGLLLPFSISIHSKKKEHLSLNMYRNISPSLLKTLYSFKRGSEQFCHLALRFSQLATNERKLLFIHERIPPLFPTYTTMW